MLDVLEAQQKAVVDAVERSDFLLGAPVRFEDGTAGRLEGLEVGVEPWTVNALLVGVGFLRHRTLRITIDTVDSATRGGISLRTVPSKVEAVGRHYHPPEGGRILNREMRFNVAEGAVRRTGMELGGLIIDRATNQVIDFVGITLVGRRRVLVPAAQAAWQAPGWIWLDLGPGGVAGASTYA